MHVTYVALVEDGSDDTAFGVVFPDLPGCFSAGDTLEDAVQNARVALGAYCEIALEEGTELPPARSIDAIKRDSSLREEFSDTTYQFVPVSAEVPAPGSFAQSESHQASARPGFEETSE